MTAKRLLTGEDGQAMVEYAYIIFLIALGSMAAVQLFGQNLIQLYNGIIGLIRG